MNKNNSIEIPKTLDKMVSIRHYKKFILENNNIDVFFHCWNTDKNSQELLINEYKP